MRLFARHDSQPGAKPYEVTPEQAERLNKADHGIFVLVNSFQGKRRKEALSKINYWYCEIDYNGKKMSVDELLKIYLVPSRVVETKHGYHLWFRASKSGVDLERYRVIQHRLREVYAGDENALDVARLLRQPGYYHLKDPKEPFLVKEILTTDAAYSEAAMMSVLPRSKYELDQEAKSAPVSPGAVVSAPVGDDFKAWIDSQNQMRLLEALSGSTLVYGDQFRFIPTTGGAFNTITNGKQSGWFIDKYGRIGSCKGGGPTVIQFIQYYGQYTSFKDALNQLREFFGR